MNPPTGTIRHPDVSEISDLTEGLLSPSRTAEVRRHLDTCALCADVRASLEEIRALLGTLPGPARMPSDVAGRIDAALAAEALLGSTAHRAEPAQMPDHTRDNASDSVVSRETTPSRVPGSEARRPGGHPAGPTGPGRRRARRRIAVIAGLAGAAACALGILLVNGLDGTRPQSTAGRSDAATSTGRSDEGTYTAQGLQDSVRQLLASGKQDPGVQGEKNNTYGMENAPPSGVAPSDRRAAPVPPCVQAATGRPDTPIATERGTYRGTDVYLVVLPHPGDLARADAYLVDAGCGDTAAAAPGKPLLTRTYPRT
ncbi:anti-sigma factor family protein [Streptomyces sp. H27-H5]|uniref:anti-sigma factor family protein n=1 Tax=Streptomyces sp. H27-H5 TaxID=2996460 RepID=UPI00226D4A56|nr:anti-sigma factor [Streptomyces sp. H27-H5]MCY0958544.1 anti-sigma factor [Streptomyces sp. H27-H5]